MSTQTEEDSTNTDEVLKFLENEIKTFEELFDELIGEHGYIFLTYHMVYFQTRKATKHLVEKICFLLKLHLHLKNQS